MRKLIGASESASIYMISVCFGTMLSLILSLALKNAGAFDGMSVYAWVGYVIMQIAFFATVIAYSKIRKVDIVHIAKVRKPNSCKQLILIPFIAIATILIFLPLANAWSSFLNIIGYKGGGVSMPNYSNVGVYFLSLFVMAILPALCEELLMRGSVMSGLSTRSVWFGILMSSMFFSLMHGNPLQTVHQFGLGIVLALVIMLSGSIWSAVLLHFANNFISITLSAYLPQVDKIYYSLGYYNWLVGFASIVVGIVMLIVLLYAFYRLGKKNKAQFRVVGGIEYDEFTIYATGDNPQSKNSAIKDFFAFFKSLFTKKGWQNISDTLYQQNEVEFVGKNQNMLGVWIAIAVAVFYWLFSFISGLI